MKKMICSLILLLLLCGCFNYKELNDYAIATSMAIDYKDNNYIVSLLISSSGSNKEEDTETMQNVVYSGDGKSIYEAIKNIGLISPNEIYIGHLSVVVISEKAAKKGLYNALDLLLTEPQSNKDFYVVLAKDTDASNILKITTPLTDFPTEYVSNNIKSTNKLQGSVVDIDFNTLIGQLIDENINPVINGFSIVGDIAKGSTESNLDTSSLYSYIKIDTLGYFKGDKLMGWASKDESRGINLINNKVNEIYLEIPCDNGNIIVNTEELTTNIKIKKDSSVDIIMSGKAIINEMTCSVDIKRKEVIEKIEKDTSLKIEDYINKAIHLAQDKKADLFGIGKLYYQNYPKEYKKIDSWDNHFANIKMKVKTNIELQENGSTKQSIERMANEKDY